MKKTFLVLLISLSVFLLCACSDDKDSEINPTEEVEENSVVDVAEHTDTEVQDMIVTKTAVTENIEMDYCRFGKGEKVFVILPGLSVKKVTPSSEAIRQAFADFTDEYTVYLFDRRNNIPDQYSIEDMAEDTVTVMKSLGIDQISVFGASQGGMIAECIAINHPDIVDKMVLGSTFCRINETTSAVVNHWIELAEEKNGYGLNESICNDIYSKATMDKYGDLLLSVGNDISDEEMSQFITIAQSINEFDIYNKLNNITSKVLVLGCEGDRVTTLEGSEEIVEKLNCEYYVYGSEYGHAVFDEATDYRSRILEFLTK